MTQNRHEKRVCGKKGKRIVDRGDILIIWTFGRVREDRRSINGECHMKAGWYELNMMK